MEVDLMTESSPVPTVSSAAPEAEAASSSAVGATRAPRLLVLADTGEARDELAAAARAVGLGEVAVDGGDGVDALPAFVAAVEAEVWDTLVVDLDVDRDPAAVLAALRHAADRDTPIVVLRRWAIGASTEVRPGIARRRMIEAALSAYGAVIAETPVAAVVAAAALRRRRGGPPLDGSAALLGAPGRIAARLLEQIGRRPGRIRLATIDGLGEAEVVVATGPLEPAVRARLGDRFLVRLGSNGESRDGGLRLERIEDLDHVLDALADHADRYRRAVPLPIETSPDLDIALDRLAPGRLDVVDATDLAVAAGLACLPFVVVGSGAEAVSRVLDLGFPVVAKPTGRRDDPTSGGPRSFPAIGRLKDLRRAVSRLLRTSGAASEGVLLQPRVEPLLEFELGSFHDPAWGAFVRLAAAGAWKAVPEAAAILPAPLSRAAARALVDRLPTAPILAGLGTAAIEGLVEAVLQVGRLAAVLGPRLPDFLLHPLAVLPGEAGVSALDVRATLAASVAPRVTVSSDRHRTVEGRRAAFPPPEPLLERSGSSVLRRL
jgi:hypothetical protein